MPWITLDVEVAGYVAFRISKAGLEVCSFHGCEPGGRDQQYIAFGDVALRLKEVSAGDELRVVGYYKTYKWRDGDYGERSREDFYIRKWERIN